MGTELPKSQRRVRRWVVVGGLGLLLLGAATVVGVIKLAQWSDQAEAEEIRKAPALLLKSCGIRLPTDARNVRAFDLDLMAWVVWGRFDAREEEVAEVLSSSPKLPGKESLQLRPEHVKALLSGSPKPWWSATDPGSCLYGQLYGRASKRMQFTSDVVVTKAVDGWCTVYVEYGEDGAPEEASTASAPAER